MPSWVYPHPEEARSAVSKDAGLPCSIGCKCPNHRCLNREIPL
jgi:hypothetical protein